MIKCVICCDFCGQPVPTRIEETPLGPVEVIETGKTKVWDTGSHLTLCKRCAALIDAELELFKMRVLCSEAKPGLSVPAQKNTKRHQKAL
jgi:hypothetical protein